MQTEHYLYTSLFCDVWNYSFYVLLYFIHDSCICMSDFRVRPFQSNVYSFYSAFRD
jgi:hypothetical protein